jgi:hypothetical protein
VRAFDATVIGTAIQMLLMLHMHGHTNAFDATVIGTAIQMMLHMM